jgi:tryptophan halogenase
MNIVIVGGGTAGWIAAYFIAKDKPGKHNITVIESSKLGIIGAGEGSTGTMIELLNGSYFDFKIDVEQFLKETDGTKKTGIYHKNWNGKDYGYFAPIDSSPSWYQYQDHVFKYVLAKYGREKMHLASYIGLEFENQKFNNTYACHFDGHKVGQFFKKICVEDNVQTIDSVVKNVNTSENGDIVSIDLDNGKRVAGDFFIDCTGFSRLLMKELNVPWKSYAEFLPVNTAMPFILDYEDGEVPLPMTSATALSAGWMWDIPLKTRRGCGYVFDRNYISKEDAQKEVETYLGKKIKPIKWIEFESGRSDVFWKNNVLTLGLASAFVEPLEATSIHSTIIQLLLFSKEFLLDTKKLTVTECNKDSYNTKITRLYDSLMEFISFHYQGGRNDSEFWRSFQEKNKVSPTAKHYLEKCKNKIPGFLEINGIIGSPSASLWNWIAGGLELISPEQAAKELTETNYWQRAELDFANLTGVEASGKSYIKYTN